MKAKIPKQIVYPNYDRFIKKFRKFGMSKDRASELAYHFWEIEAFCVGFSYDMKDILKSKNKKEITEVLDSIQDEFSGHIIEHHFLPARKLLKKIGFKRDIHPELDYSMKTVNYDKSDHYESLKSFCKTWDNFIKNKKAELKEIEREREKIGVRLVKLKIRKNQNETIKKPNN